MNSQTGSVVLAHGCGQCRAQIKRVLERGDYRVSGEAGDGLELLERWQEKNPEVLILEVSLPCLDGLSAGAYLRQQGWDGVIFFLSDHGDEGLTAALREVEADGCLTMPVTEKQLLPCLKAALARRAAMKHLRQEHEQAERKLGDLRTMELARSAVMERQGLDSREALAFLQRLAGEKGIPLERLAAFYAAYPVRSAASP